MLLRHSCLAHPAVTMRRSALQAVGGYRFKGVEDYDLWLRMSERFELANLPEPMILHRLHLQSLSLRILEKIARDAWAVCAAARLRRASGIDPLAGVEELTPEVLDRLGVSEVELHGAVERELITPAAILAVDLGQHEQADQLVQQATRLYGGRAARAFSASSELKQAENLFKTARRRAAL
jgi:hypothetical protein